MHCSYSILFAEEQVPGVPNFPTIDSLEIDTQDDLSLGSDIGDIVPKTQDTTQQTDIAQKDIAPQAIQKNNSSKNKESDADKENEEANKNKKDIYLNFENTDLTNFINYIGELKKINIIIDRMLQGVKISLTIREPLNLEGAWNIFLTVLEMSGFSIIKTGDVYKVIPRDRKLMQALPSYINVPSDTLPDSDLEIRYVMFLQNIQVGDVRDLLISMLSQPSAVIDQRDVNGFIITDKSYNIKAAAKLLQELDQMGLQETVTVLKLKNVNAIDAKSLLDSIIKKPDGGPLARLLGKTAEGSTDYFPQGTRIIAEERTNALILLGTTNAINKIVDFIQQHIDTTLQGTESPLHIYELKHTDAQQIVEILRTITEPPADFVPGQQAAKYGAIRGGVKYFRSMTFVVDRDSNRIIVSSTDKEDWRLLKKTISELDKPQPQIALETLVVSVTVDDIKELSGALRNKFHGQIGKNIDFHSSALGNSLALEGEDTSGPVSLLGNMISQLVSERGASVLTFGTPQNIWGVFKALKQQTNATLLSQPFITITNKTSGVLEFGETKRVVDETAESNSGFKDATASTIIKATPQINLDGLIRLDLDIHIAEFTDTSGNNQEQRDLVTNVTVANGQVLVLGGFVKTKVTEAKNKTPLLGDIPILGWLFKRQKRTVSKNYIFVFMSPTIIKPRTTPGMQLYTKMKMHDATDQIENAVETKRIVDPIHNWFFNPEKESYSHKVIDFANARYQPTTVDIANDAYYGQVKEIKKNQSNIQAMLDQKDTTIEADKTMLVAQKTTPESIAIQNSIRPQPTTALKIREKNKQINETIQTKKKKSLQDKREQLKQLLSGSQKNTSSPKKKSPTISEKRRALKQLLSARNTRSPLTRSVA